MIKSTLTPKIITTAAALLFGFNALLAQAENVVEIPKVNDAQVFAEFLDKLPAVANYFTAASEADVIAFYQNLYGEATSQDRKRGRLTLYFSDEKYQTRVVISQQNKKRQVDVLVEIK